MKNLICLVSLCFTLGVCHISVCAQQKVDAKVQPQSTTQGTPDNSSQTTERVYRGSDVDQKAVILSKPQPPYTAEARKKGVAGTVRLRMVLRPDGEVIDIKALTGLPYGLTENAIEAARLIKFQPAVKDGRAVPQYVTFEYNFGIIGQSLLGDEVTKVYYRSDCVDYSLVGGREKLIIFSNSKEAKKAGYKEAKTKCP
ncbi:MAG TPA: energy transducer TonB [Pyrinomonadaceae bacterium]|nr:energy transducer TonB [Pyrinomonadaceae bacterium]